jgi:hypothetical protein
MPLPAVEAFAIVRLPATQGAFQGVAEVSTEAAHDKKERDSFGEMLHNLASLLMNTTLHRQAEHAVPNRVL